MLKVELAAVVLILFSPTILQKDFSLKKYWVIWNVGQGSWSTLITKSECQHFDMGGEENPLPRVVKTCHRKNNLITLSHWDWDHIGFALKAAKKLYPACLELPPRGKSSRSKNKLLSIIPPCDSPATTNSTLRLISENTASTSKMNSNDLSRVVIADNRILLPGDSSKKEELIWSTHSHLKNIRYLLLGHHGSRTSTSEELLQKLPQLKIAIASARSARYGHPHPETLSRLNKYHIPLVKTEDWGNLWFEFPP